MLVEVAIKTTKRTKNLVLQSLQRYFIWKGTKSIYKQNKYCTTYGGGRKKNYLCRAVISITSSWMSLYHPAQKQNNVCTRMPRTILCFTIPPPTWRRREKGRRRARGRRRGGLRGRPTLADQRLKQQFLRESGTRSLVYFKPLTMYT